MRVFRVDGPGGPRCGEVIDGRGVLFRPGTDALHVLQDPALAAAARTEETVDLDGPLLTPIQPATIRDFITFEQHTAGSLRSVTDAATVPDIWYEIPGFYFTNPHAVVGSGAEVPVPPGCELFDFELEVAAVIGTDGYNLSVEEAARSIAGLTIFNDWSARDLQRREMTLGLGPAKGKDTVSTLGPYVVSVDELADAHHEGFWDLDMEVTLNGERIGGDSLANMAWTFAELISYASRGTWVRAGDVVGSGTAGGGCLAEFWGWRGSTEPGPLEPGDEVAMSVERLGTIRNVVVEGPPLHAVPPARRRPYKQPVGLRPGDTLR